MNKLLSRFSHKHQLSGATLHAAEITRAAEELKILENDLQAAAKIFRDKSRRAKCLLPLYLIIGQASFGKTTLLANSGLDLKDVCGQHPRSDLSTKYCDWFFSDEAVFLDVAGIYSKSANADKHANLVWLGFLQRLLKLRTLRRALSGIIVVVDIPTLLGPAPALQKVLSDAKERLYELAHYVKHLPVTVVFSKADHLPGFVDYCATLADEDISYPFGISFCSDSEHMHKSKMQPQQVFTAGFADLVQCVQGRVWQQLHSQKNSKHHFGIINFPAAIAGLRTALLEVLSIIPYGGAIELGGLYFVSSIQQGTGFNFLLRSLAKTLQMPIADSSFDIQQGKRRYFTDALFKAILHQHSAPNLHAEPVKYKHEFSWAQTFVTSFLSVILIAASFAWYESYARSVEMVNKLTVTLQKQAPGDEEARLEKAIYALNQNPSPWWSYLGLPQLREFQASLNKLFTEKVAPDFADKLQASLEDELTAQINNAEKSDYRYLYSTLRVYLMLSKPEKMDRAAVQDWFDKYWQRQINDSTVRQQNTVELRLLLDKSVKITPTEATIKNARLALKQNANAQQNFAYTALEDIYREQDLVFPLHAQVIKISKLYSLDNLENVYQQKIPAVAANLKKQDNDWVLVDDSNHDAAKESKAAEDQLVAALRHAYIKNYIDVWNRALLAVQVDNPKNIKSLAQFLSEVNSNQFALLSLLQAAQDNLNFSKLSPEIKEQISINPLLSLKDVDIKAIYAAIYDLSRYTDKIARASDSDKTAFTLAAQRFQANQEQHRQDSIATLLYAANKAPEPVRGILRAIAEASWQLTLVSARHYVGKMWEHEVMPQYKRTVANSYPFFKDATRAISFDDLTAFFAVDGVMDKFFNTYLRPFVDIDQVYWVWKDVDGQKLSSEQDALDVFIRAALIKKMFYANGGSFPEVKFTLVPQALTPHTAQFKFNVAGQILIYKAGEHKQLASNITWPGVSPGLVNIEFTGTDNKIISSSMPQDNWAWFRFLEKANLKAVNGTEHFSFIVDLNGNAIKYDLYPEQPINPFIKDVIGSFRCNEKLFAL